jgi:hypothetical protein
MSRHSPSRQNRKERVRAGEISFALLQIEERWKIRNFRSFAVGTNPTAAYFNLFAVGVLSALLTSPPSSIQEGATGDDNEDNRGT